MKRNSLLIICLLLITQGCSSPGNKSTNKEIIMKPDSTSQYGYTRDFLKKYTRIVELKNNNSLLALAPEWQGRVMTSSGDGDSGFSFGWVNRNLIASGKLSGHINAFGGEERLWLGPEGGQFSLFFVKGTEFVYDNWQTPDFIDSKPWEIVSVSEKSASFRTDASHYNYSGTRFDIGIERRVSILDGIELAQETGISADSVRWVAYRSENTIINKGSPGWNRKSGLVSIWMLGMFIPSPSVVVVIPIREGDEKTAGAKVNDNYFGRIASDRLRISGNHIFFRADGKSRGKIGIPPLRTAGVMGSFDSKNNILTLLFCRLPEGITDYVNSAWQLQDNPFSGDAFNSYNDGPLSDGSQMGPFYELETSSPAAALEPGKALTHRQLTVHITGDRKQLDVISLKALGVSLKQIEEAFK